MLRNVTVGILLLSLGGVAKAAITDDLVLYLPFDESMGTIAPDLSGNGHDAEIFNRRTLGSNPNAVEDGPLPTPDNGGSVDWWFWNAEGRFGGAFSPRGVADEEGNPTPPPLANSPHAMAASNFGANIDSPAWSVSLWAQLPYNAENTDTNFVFYNSFDWAEGFPDSTPDYWNFGEIQSPRWMYLEKLSAGNNNNLFLGYAAGGANAVGDPSADITDGEWHNIVVTVDYDIDPMDSGVQDGFIYVDGQLASSVSFSGATRTNGVIGAFTVAHASTFGGDTNAYIDDFAVWNRVLTPQEITFLSQNSVLGMPLPDGDFNMDGFWNCTDVDALVVQIVDVKGGATPDLSFDMTGDGTVNDDDLAEWLVVGGAENSDDTGGNPFLVGDATLDGSVDVSDFNDWNAAKFTSVAAWCSGDFNADGTVDVSDFNLWNANKFSSSAGPNVVPEPSGLFLSGIVLVCFAACSRRR